MGMVVCFVKIHIRPYMDDIFTLIRVSDPVNTPEKKTRNVIIHCFPVSRANSLKLLIALSRAPASLAAMLFRPSG